MMLVNFLDDDQFSQLCCCIVCNCAAHQMDMVFDHLNLNLSEFVFVRELPNHYRFSLQFVIFSPWKVPWKWIAFDQNYFVILPGCYISWLDATLYDLQMNPIISSKQ